MNGTVLLETDAVKYENSNKVVYVVPTIKRQKADVVYEVTKRTFDFVLSGLASLALVLPFLIIAVLIKCDSEGPVFYKQERLGKDGKPFMLYKFRSMRVDAEKNGAQWASDNDDRCTRMGKVIRKFRLDELPQIPFNILPGTLSIVGPRPERKVFYDEFATYIHGFDQRLAVTQGLTGWAQVNGGYDLKPEEKIIYDVEYIENRSLWMDVKIIWKTVAIVFNHNGAR